MSGAAIVKIILGGVLGATVAGLIVVPISAMLALPTVFAFFFGVVGGAVGANVGIYVMASR